MGLYYHFQGREDPGNSIMKICIREVKYNPNGLQLCADS